MSIDQNEQASEAEQFEAERSKGEQSEAEQLAALFNASGAGTLIERMGIDIVTASRDEIIGTMPVEGNTQVYGLLHGGASVVLAETLGSLLAAVHAGPDKQVVGVDINATHHRSATSGLVTGTCRVLSAGRTLVVSEIVITDESGRRCCTSRITCLIKR